MEPLVSQDIRVGHGIDVHRFDDDRPLMIGGLELSPDGGLAGHSDADVVLHAITDAILGALAQGDIGSIFPSDDPNWENASSHLFVKEAKRRLEESGSVLTGVDVTIIGNHPRVAPVRLRIRQSIADILAVSMERVSVKATTTDGLGFTGRGEGLCAIAVVTIAATPRS